MKRGDIVVEKYEGKADKFAGNGLHIHVSSNGVLCVRRYDKNIKVYAPGEWKTADVVE